jgi:hypothetical protein
VYRIKIESVPGSRRFHTFEIVCEEGNFKEGDAAGVTLLPKPLALLAQ